MAALVVLSVLALLAYDTTDPPQTAVAATDCVAKPGDQRLGDTLLHIPPKPPVGLVIALHGAGGTGDGFAGGTGFSDAADDHGFAVLYPSAAKRHFWSLNDQMGTTDLENLRALLPQAEALACTDRVFATGVSNGGGFTARVACELDDIVAIAPVAGGYRALDPCPSTRRVSLLEIHGTADHVVPYNGKKPDYAGSVPRYLSGWAKRDGCTGKTSKRETKVVTHLRYSGCAAGLAVEHLRLKDVDHGWPDAAWGLDTNEAVLRFFARNLKGQTP
ncbi:alpha/beta hydrolase family esterase [Solirubrobacter soli]|uniref:alpha/beta hydrolase family esterase n=1 Tax=Solirubrobacter soli TaxID=363832 RepID=UPI00040208C1|nr:PHB depolymerase family esterase [Solirubrobacter soli]